MTTSFFTRSELEQLGLKHVGNNVLISRKASIYGANKIVIGNNVRIDDFCILSGRITFGNNIHLAAYSAMYGGEAGIIIHDFANISSRVCIYAISDDYSGRTMTNPTIPEKYKHIQNEKVIIGKHVIIGSGSTVLPGVTIEEGAALGAMTMLKYSTKPWTIYVGVPAKELKERKRELLELEADYIKQGDQEHKN